MNFVAITKHYMPNHNAGSEKMLHSLLCYLVNSGHKCKVFCYEIDNDILFDTIDGVDCYYGSSINSINVENEDWIISHLETALEASDLANKFNKKVCHLMHFDWASDKGFTYSNCDLMLFNCYSMASASLKHDIPSFVIYPPIETHKYPIINRDKKFITLINHNKNKGGEILIEVAKALPNKQFLAVSGAYGDQVKSNLPNITYLEHQKDINKVFDETEILLILSKYESWGKVAIEAQSAGIPVIHTDPVGLKEAVGLSGIEVDRRKIGSIVTAINKMTNHYSKYREESINNSRKLEAKSLIQLEKLLKYFNNSTDFFCSKDKNDCLSEIHNKPVIWAGKKSKEALVKRDPTNISKLLEEVQKTIIKPKVGLALKTFSHGKKYSKGDLVFLNERELNQLIKMGYCEVYANNTNSNKR